jgi:hypothetical protein
VKERFLYFKPQGSFDLDEYLSHSWGIVDDEEVTVKVRFSADAADYVLHKKQDLWGHPLEGTLSRAFLSGPTCRPFSLCGTELWEHPCF